VRMEGLGQLKNPYHRIRNRDVPACSILPQPTTLPRAPVTSIVTVSNCVEGFPKE
jgi:hypothetical protein